MQVCMLYDFTRYLPKLPGLYRIHLITRFRLLYKRWRQSGIKTASIQRDFEASRPGILVYFEALRQTRLHGQEFYGILRLRGQEFQYILIIRISMQGILGYFEAKKQAVHVHWRHCLDWRPWVYTSSIFLMYCFLAAYDNGNSP